MSSRDEFFKKFEIISSSFTENISIFYLSDCMSIGGITYFELNRVSSELSDYFSTIFENDSQYVGVSLSDYCFLPCIILAIWKSGNYFAGAGDQYTRKNTLHFFNFLEVNYLISDNEKNDYDGTLAFSFQILHRLFFIWKRPLSSKKLEKFENICYGIMTSGSTGEPKIIQVPWSCILPNSIELSLKFKITASDCIFQSSPSSFDPFFIELIMTLLSGCTLMIISNSLKLNTSNLLRILFDSSEETSLPSDVDVKFKNYFHVELKHVKKKKVTVLQITPSCFKRWSHCEIQNFILSAESPLRILILGGEKFPKEILKLKHSANTTKIFNIYGITEISCWAFINEITGFFSGTEVSLGKPLSNIVYKLLENGELCIGSKSRICFINNESLPQTGETVFRNTGDVVDIVNDELYYLGRNDHIVKKFGIKINTSKIEDLFKCNNNFIKESYCVHDDDNLVLGLFFVLIDNKVDVHGNILTYTEFCKNYKIPIDDLKDIEKPNYFIEIKEIPLNFHGKCDRRKLVQQLKDSCSLKKSELKLNTFFEGLWTKALGVKKLDLFSLGFKELGGTSIMALDIINTLKDAGFYVPQNFINKLLGGENYFECLECLSLNAEENQISHKKIKLDTNFSDVKLSIRWKSDLGKCIDATPAVFTFKGEERIVIGSHSSRLSCFNSESGFEFWSICLGDRIESTFTPTKDGHKGFIGCYDHYIYCISSEDGNIIWKFKTNDMIKSKPCLSSNENTVFVGSYDKHLYCLSSADGRVNKSLKPSNGSIFCSGIVSDTLNQFYVGTLDGTCVAVDQEANHIVWKNLLESPIFASPCLINKNNEILISEVLGNVHCLSAIDGVKMWTYKTGGNIYSSPIVEDMNIIFGCHDSHLYCLQYDQKPTLKWKQQLDSYVFSRPAIVLKSLVCGATTKGVIYLCDISSGVPATRLDLKGEVFSSPVYSKNRLFVGCRDDNFYSIDISKT